MKEMITIELTEYNELFEAQMKLMCLERAGVDNWDGYDAAMESFEDIMSK